MFFEVAGVGELLGAEDALVRPLSRVDVLVDLHVPKLGEHFPADVTGEGFLPGVRPQMGL